MAPMKRKEVERLLHENGFYSHRKGSHEIFRHYSGCIAALPYHSVVSPGTLKNILKQISSSKTSNNANSSYSKAS